MGVSPAKAVRLPAISQDLQEENRESRTLPMGNLSAESRKPPRRSVRVCVRTCAYTSRGVSGAVPGGFPDRCPASCSGSRVLHPSPQCPATAPPPAASRQPFVVADVRLCHGNARTGCTSGSRQGQAHAHGLPTPRPSPKACCEEPCGREGRPVFVCGEREAVPTSSEESGWGRGSMWVHIPAESSPPQLR